MEHVIFCEYTLRTRGELEWRTLLATQDPDKLEYGEHEDLCFLIDFAWQKISKTQQVTNTRVEAPENERVYEEIPILRWVEVI